MRKLRFIVDDQIIKPDPDCDFSNLVPGTEGYLQAEFEFTSHWNGCVKVAAFFSAGQECPPQKLKNGKTCIIPAEACKNQYFKVQVLGRGKNRYKILTNTVIIDQNGGKA